MSVTDKISQRTGKYIGIALLALFAAMLGESFRRTYSKIQQAQEIALIRQAEWQVEGIDHWLETQYRHLDELGITTLLLNSGANINPQNENGNGTTPELSSNTTITSHLQLSLDRLPQFEWLAVTDANGEIQSLVWQGEEAFPVNPPRVPLIAQSYFQQAMRGVPGAAYHSTSISDSIPEENGSNTSGSLNLDQRPSPNGTGSANYRLSSTATEIPFPNTGVSSSAPTRPRRENSIIVAVPLWSWPPLMRDAVRSPAQLDIRHQSLETLSLTDMAAPTQAPYPVGVIFGEISADVLLAEALRNRNEPAVQLTFFDPFGRSLYSDWYSSSIGGFDRAGTGSQIRFKDLNLVDSQRLLTSEAGNDSGAVATAPGSAVNNGAGNNAIEDGATVDNAAVRRVVVGRERLYATAQPIPQLGGHVVVSSRPSDFEAPLYPLRAMGLGGLILGGQNRSKRS